MLSKPESALVIVGHGSTVNPDSSEPTLARADEIRRKGIFMEVACCFWKEDPSMREVRHMLESRDVYVVPNFISEGYFTQTVIPRELELKGNVTIDADGRCWKYCDPVGSHARMTELLLKRARDVAPDISPADASLLIVGHGTSLNDNSAVAAKTQVELIRERNEFGEVQNAYMEEDPLISQWDSNTTKPNVIVVPFFISDGLHSYQDIPVLLGIESEPTAAASERSIFRRNPYHLRGRTLYYANSIGTEPGFANIIVDQVTVFDRNTAA
jgi:sirohydrochlorin cobaltochelatase